MLGTGLLEGKRLQAVLGLLNTVAGFFSLVHARTRARMYTETCGILHKRAQSCSLDAPGQRTRLLAHAHGTACLLLLLLHLHLLLLLQRRRLLLLLLRASLHLPHGRVRLQVVLNVHHDDRLGHALLLDLPGHQLDGVGPAVLDHLRGRQQCRCLAHVCLRWAGLMVHSSIGRPLGQELHVAGSNVQLGPGQQRALLGKAMGNMGISMAAGMCCSGARLSLLAYLMQDGLDHAVGLVIRVVPPADLLRAQLLKEHVDAAQ
jgi:hypothetical protein